MGTSGPSPEKIANVIKHLQHEYSMLNGTAALIPKYDPQKAETDEERIIGNALIESFAVHARNLKEFFFYSPKDDYARAEDFFSDPEHWKSTRGILPKVLKLADPMMNNQISHLTYRRTTMADSDFDWHFDGIVRAIDETMKHFKELLESKRTVVSDLSLGCRSSHAQPRDLSAKTECPTVAPPPQNRICPGMQARTVPENGEDDTVIEL